MLLSFREVGFAASGAEDKNTEHINVLPKIT